MLAVEDGIDDGLAHGGGNIYMLNVRYAEIND